MRSTDELLDEIKEIRERGAAKPLGGIRENSDRDRPTQWELLDLIEGALLELNVVLALLSRSASGEYVLEWFKKRQKARFAARRKTATKGKVIQRPKTLSGRKLVRKGQSR